MILINIDINIDKHKLMNILDKAIVEYKPIYYVISYDNFEKIKHVKPFECYYTKILGMVFGYSGMFIKHDFTLENNIIIGIRTLDDYNKFQRYMKIKTLKEKIGI